MSALRIAASFLELTDQRFRRAAEPGFDQHFLEVGDLDLPETHEDRGVAVEMRGCEAHRRTRGEPRLFHDEIGDVDPEDVALRRFGSQCLEVGFPEGPLPGEALASHEPGAVVVPETLGRLGKPKRDAADVVPGGHARIVLDEGGTASNESGGCPGKALVRIRRVRAGRTPRHRSTANGYLS